MATNYVMDAVRGYKAVDDIFRNKRLEERYDHDREIALNDRKQQMRRQEKADERNDVLAGRQDKEYENQMQLRELNALEIEKIFGPDVAKNPQAVAKAGSFLQDPKRTGQTIALYDEISQYMSSGKTPPMELLAEYMNTAGAEEMAARGGDDGLQRSVDVILPGTKPDGVVIGFNVTGKDGKQYKAPMTTGASADPNDNEVQEIPISKLMEWGGGAAMTAKQIAMAKARAGDNSFLESYRAAVAERQKRAIELQDFQAKRQMNMQDFQAKQGMEMASYEGKKKIDQKYADSKLVAAGRYGMYDPDKKQFIENPYGDKKGTGSKLETKWNDDGTINVYHPDTGKVERKMSEEQAMQEADMMAQQWAEDQSKGIFNLRPNDADVQVKRDEIYNQLTGGQQGQNSAPNSPKFEPGQKVKQDGKTFVVNEQGEPVEQPKKEPKQEKVKPLPSPKQTAKSRMAELKKSGQGNQLISTAGVDGLTEAGKNLVQSFGNAGKVALDLYQSLVGEPFINAIKMAKISQEKSAAQFVLDNRYKNGIISEDDYEKAYALINK